MKLEGNNAERIASLLIFFIILLIIYILVSLAFSSITHSKIENMIKDGMGFAVTGIAPIIAILLFNDWRHQHRLVKSESESQLIVNSFDEIKQNFLINIGIMNHPQVYKDLDFTEVFKRNADIGKLIYNLKKKIEIFKQNNTNLQFSSISDNCYKHYSLANGEFYSICKTYENDMLLAKDDPNAKVKVISNFHDGFKEMYLNFDFGNSELERLRVELSKFII
ncbi:hypothetical protein OHV35_01975 [Acinetobacter baumannii]|nr:hypothetical protein [Acinetobacter baumannii]